MHKLSIHKANFSQNMDVCMTFWTAYAQIFSKFLTAISCNI